MDQHMFSVREMNKILSVIVPTYNMEKYLHKCLDSLIVDLELMKKLEVLIINDGSKDSSSIIAHKYENEYPGTFVAIDKENGNYGSCINVGLKTAKGRYIKILDAGDWFDNHNFAWFLEKLENIDTDIVISDFLHFNYNKGVVHEQCYNFPTDIIFRLSDFYPDAVIQMHAITYRNDLLRQMNYTQSEGISYTDTEWFLLPLIFVKTAIYLNKSIYVYLVGRDGQTTNYRTYSLNYGQHIKVLKRIITILNRHSEYDAEQYALYALHRNVVFMYSTLLQTYRIKVDYKDLSNFDLFLKQSKPDLYDSLNSLSTFNKFPFYYVKEWRRNNYIGLNIFRVRLGADAFVRRFWRMGKQIVERR